MSASNRPTDFDWDKKAIYLNYWIGIIVIIIPNIKLY